MSSMNIMGTYSGITTETIDQLIEAESSRGIKFTNKKATIEKQQNSWKDINTRLDTLFNRLEVFSKKETFNSKTVSSNISESDILSVSAGVEAADGQYRIQVTRLAESTRLTGAKVNAPSSTTALAVAGSFSFSSQGSDGIEGDIQNITVETTDSLKDISTKINDLTESSGVQASIVDNRLVLTNTQMGASQINIKTDSSSPEDVALVQRLGFGQGQATLTIGKSALFNVNGIDVERNTNTIEDVVEGLTIHLNNVHQGESSELITVSSDVNKTTQAVKDFVDQYNSVMSFIEEQIDVGDPSLKDNKTGALTGDGTVIRLQSGLRSLMSRDIVGDFSGAIKNIEDIGIILDRYGKATLDETVFKEALELDPTNVARFFYSPDTTPEIVKDGVVIKEAEDQEGVSELLRNFIDSYISSSTTSPGIITNKSKSYDKMLKNINKQIDTFNERIERKRDRYIQQFTAVDLAMMQAQSQLDYMYSQMGMSSSGN